MNIKTKIHPKLSGFFENIISKRSLNKTAYDHVIIFKTIYEENHSYSLQKMIYIDEYGDQ